MHAFVATVAVMLAPAAAVTVLEMRGHVESGALGLALGAALSVLIAAGGSRIWARFPGSRDVVFSDLMLWGFVRRLRTERRLKEARGILGLNEHRFDTPDLDGEHAAKVLEQLSAALEARDVYTLGHSKRVTRHSHMIAVAMGLPEDQVTKIRTAAAIHDSGKARTPRSVINKPGRLNAVQQQIMKRHSIDGAKMAEAIGDPEITAMVRHHHERLDGEGYPDRLSGNEIPLGARIIAVADTYDAMTSARAYRTAMRHSRALKILRREAGRQLDSQAVNAFVKYYSGQRTIAWWAIWGAAPQRLAAWISSLLNTTGAASLSQSVAAIGTAAAIAGGAAETSRHHRDAAHHSSRPAAVYSAPAAYASGGTEVPQEVTLPETTPVSSAPRTSSPHSSVPSERKADQPSTHTPVVAVAPPAHAGPKPQKQERETGGETAPPKKEVDPDSGLVTKPGNGVGRDPDKGKPAKPSPPTEPVADPEPSPTGGGSDKPKGSKPKP